MKKIFTLIAALIAVFAIHATDYVAPMAIDVDGELAPQGDVVISLDTTEAGYDLTIRNFIFAVGPEDTMAIGNITATGIQGTEEAGVISLKADARATVTNGDLEGVNFWMGPILLANGVDLSVDLQADGTTMRGKFTMNVLAQNIVVYVGEPKPESTDYVEPMAIDVDGNLVPQGDVVITLEKTEAGYNLTIRNFIFAVGPDDTMAIGNITATGIEGTEEAGVISLKADARATVTNGDLEGVNFWMGPILLANGVDLTVDLQADGTTMRGKFTMNVLAQNIVVYVGEPKPEPTDYVEPMAIEVDGNMVPQGDVVITLEKTEAGYNLTIRNFIFAVGPEDTMAIGNITATGIEGTEEAGVISLKADARATVTNGDLEGVNFWMGPILLANGVDLTVDLQTDGDSMEGKFSMNVLMQDVVVFVGEKTIEGLSGVSNISMESTQVISTYDLTGKMVNSTVPGNIYIRKYSDGRAVKFFAK